VIEINNKKRLSDYMLGLNKWEQDVVISKLIEDDLGFANYLIDKWGFKISLFNLFLER